ncbi:ATP-binding protein [Sinosporangium album]|nr:LuxR C-terminal-related transcriptional regulator [Sinosporangium album]
MNRRGELPAELTPFIGRRGEVASVRRMLQHSRLVTVTGIPGVGKTRVALRAAHSLRRAFTGGVHLVELSSLSDERRLEQVVAHALDVPDRSTRPAAEVLAEYLADRELLLVLDTCEHLVDACSQMAQTLLAAAPGLRVLATSRQVLGAPGEHSLVVHPMAVPVTPEPVTPAPVPVTPAPIAPVPVTSAPVTSAPVTSAPVTPAPADPAAPESVAPVSVTALGECDSVRLFLDRVRAVDPGFTLTGDNAPAVAELCRRLDGIPLAIELAAVRARALPVSRILQLIRERPGNGSGAIATADARHQTMWAAIAWSHDLCTAEERTLWARLSVFSGGFDLVAANAVCADETLPAGRVFPALDGLVEKSIVVCVKQGHRTHYRMLDSIREYGKAQWHGPAEALSLATRHRDHYLAEAEAASRTPPGGDQVAEWSRVRDDWPNLRAALEFCAARPGEAPVGLRLASALWFLWVACGMTRDGRHHLETLLAFGEGNPAERSRALLRLAYLAAGQGDFTAAKAALAECGGLGVREERVHMLKVQGTVSFSRGDIETADKCLSEAVRGPGGESLPPTVRLTAMVELGLTYVWAGRIDAAASVLEECRAVCLAQGEAWSRSWADIGLALVARAKGDAAAAVQHARGALRVGHELQDAVGTALSMELLAWIAADEEVPERAARLLSAAHQRWSSVGRFLFGSPHFLAEHQRHEERLGRLLTPAAYADAVSAGRALPTDEIVAYALGPSDSPALTPGPSLWAPLSPREREVAELVADGLTNRQIAQRLVVARRTVDTHVEHILAKLGFSGRAQVAAWAANRRGDERRRGAL